MTQRRREKHRKDKKKRVAHSSTLCAPHDLDPEHSISQVPAERIHPPLVLKHVKVILHTPIHLITNTILNSLIISLLRRSLILLHPCLFRITQARRDLLIRVASKRLSLAIGLLLVLEECFESRVVFDAVFADVHASAVAQAVGVVCG
jgi:hypothetical protein